LQIVLVGAAAGIVCGVFTLMLELAALMAQVSSAAEWRGGGLGAASISSWAPGGSACGVPSWRALAVSAQLLSEPMARGFESKNVESQQDERARGKEVGPDLSAERPRAWRAGGRWS
jgi:hypothetical protein